jgi:hypothetical protein
MWWRVSNCLMRTFIFSFLSFDRIFIDSFYCHVVPGGHWYWEEPLSLCKEDLAPYLNTFTGDCHALLLFGKSRQLDSATWCANECVAWMGNGDEASFREAELHKAMGQELQQLDRLQSDVRILNASWVANNSDKQQLSKEKKAFEDQHKVKPMWALFDKLEKHVNMLPPSAQKTKLQQIVLDMHKTFDLHSNAIVNSTGKCFFVQLPFCFVSNFRSHLHKKCELRRSAWAK